ncbi:hypothetical protein SARC_16238, partial [Sphaeroforma arctica JP610]
MGNTVDNVLLLNDTVVEDLGKYLSFHKDRADADNMSGLSAAFVQAKVDHENAVEAVCVRLGVALSSLDAWNVGKRIELK